MDIPYFFEAEIQTGASSFTLGEATSKHVIQVLRMKAGEVIHLTNGNGFLFTAIIISLDKRNCHVQIQAEEFIAPSAKKISVAIGLLKNTGRFEWFVEKATELGIAEVKPLLSTRTNREHFRFDRTQQVMISAMLQSKQAWLPVLHKPQTVEQLIGSSAYQHNFIAHCLEEDKQEIPSLPSEVAAQILIGPEGDFTKEEIALALQNNYTAVTLGNTRLRTETAGVVAATLLMLK